VLTSATVRAKTYCNIVALDKQDVAAVIKYYPNGELCVVFVIFTEKDESLLYESPSFFN